jgi:hypothetical protein
VAEAGGVLMLLLFFNPQGVAPPVGINVGEVIQRLLPALGVYRVADLTHWTEAELYRYADEAVKRLARNLGLFAERDAVTVAGGTALYATPTRHLDTIHASLGGANLRPAKVRELEALDATWQGTAGAVEKYTHDFQGTEHIRLYRTPSAGGTLALVFRQYPADVSQASPMLAAPSVFEDYLTWAILAQARGKESDAAMPEEAKHAAERQAQFEELIRQHWGEAQ